MRRSAILAPLAAILASQAGCSLTGLTDFTIFQCSEHAECEPLNQSRGIAEDACVRYQCAVDSRCRLQPLDLDRDGHADLVCAGSEGCGGSLPCDDCDDTAASAFPGQSEVCDGVDNDCNLVVDDVASGEASSLTLVSGTDMPTWHVYGQPLEGSRVAPVSFGRGMATYFNVVDRDEVGAQTLGAATAHLTEVSSTTIMPGCPNDDVRVPTPSTPVGAGGPCTSHDDCSDGVLCNGFELCDPADSSADPTTGCVTDMTETACRSGGFCNEERGVCELGSLAIATSCTVAELAAAEISTGEWFAALKSPGGAGCGGLLRVGYFTENMTDGRNDPGRRVLYRGDFTRSTSFRGVDIVSNEGGDCTGHSRPDGEPLGVRSVALAALPANPGAGRQRAQALVAFLAGPDVAPSRVEVIGLWQETFSGALWVNATGNGVQQPLDTLASGESRPAIVAWRGDDEGYLLAYGADGGGIAIRFIPAFPDDDEVSSAGTTPILPGATEPRATEPIADLGVELILPTSGVATNVTLVIGRGDGAGAELALAWQDDEGVRFSTLGFDANAPRFAQFEPQMVASGAADEIALAYAPSGLVLPGFERGGAQADGSSSGGYLIAWRAGGAVSGARFAELDGARVGPDVMRLGGDLRRIGVYLASTESDAGTERLVPRLVYHDTAAQEFRGLQAFCGPPG